MLRRNLKKIMINLGKKVVLFILLAVVCQSAAISLPYYEAAKQAYNDQKYDLAEAYFKQAIKDSPEHVSARYYYAQILIQREELKKAQDEYKKIIEIAPFSEAAKLSIMGIVQIQDYVNNRHSNYSLSADGNVNLNNALKAELMRGIGDNYIEVAAMKGQITRWNANKMPINVFYAFNKKDPTHKPFFLAAVKRSFDIWAKHTEGNLKVNTTNNRDEAQVVIIFKSGIDNKAPAGRKKQKFISGLTTPHIQNGILQYFDIMFSTAKIDGAPYSEAEFFATALHEVGHALGIMGHSSVKGDIMYPVAHNASDFSSIKLSERDINTIKLLYRMDADISNFDSDELAKKDTKKNDLVLGNEENRLNSKLEEAKEYVKTAPDHAISWTSLGSAYYSMKKFPQAIKNFKRALNIDPEFTSAREQLAHTYLVTKDMINAIRQYDILSKKHPRELNYSKTLIKLFIKQKDFLNAKGAANKTIKSNPSALEDAEIKKFVEELKKY